MAIEGISSTPSAPSDLAAATKKTLGKEEFLRLLTVQLKSQNPLNPLDGADFTAQMATFSSLEQLTNLGKSMDNLLLFQSSLQNTMSVGLIGRHVRTEGGQPHQVRSVEFQNGAASLVLDDGTRTQLGSIVEITA